VPTRTAILRWWPVGAALLFPAIALIIAGTPLGNLLVSITAPSFNQELGEWPDGSTTPDPFQALGLIGLVAIPATGFLLGCLGALTPKIFGRSDARVWQRIGWPFFLAATAVIGYILAVGSLIAGKFFFG
jgi:hypothetical protein